MLVRASHSKLNWQFLPEENPTVLGKTYMWREVLKELGVVKAAGCKSETGVRTGMAYAAFAVVIVDRPGNLRIVAEDNHYTVVVVRACDLLRKY